MQTQNICRHRCIFINHDKLEVNFPVFSAAPHPTDRNAFAERGWILSDRIFVANVKKLLGNSRIVGTFVDRIPVQKGILNI